ncbi:hypothetical protein B0H14DRAFT_3906303 [Mycena olivaceomarginata]|nr:hypothetical protein B0H14DRAFT_3906303 [Mycena olivaceomarginata]
MASETMMSWALSLVLDESAAIQILLLLSRVPLGFGYAGVRTSGPAASLVLAVPAPFKREGLTRDAASAATSSSGTANGAASSVVICPPVDKAGSALTASSSFDDEDGNEFSECTYPVAGACAFFFADGSFSQGSSQCPKGLAQTGTGGDSTTTYVHIHHNRRTPTAQHDQHPARNYAGGHQHPTRNYTGDHEHPAAACYDERRLSPACNFQHL